MINKIIFKAMKLNCDLWLHLPDLPLEDSLKLKIPVSHYHLDRLAKILPLRRLTFGKDNLKILVLAVLVGILSADLIRSIHTYIYK
jgi:hypothetical protein